MTAVFQRNPEIETRQVSGSLFLVDSSNESLLCLNDLGAGVWFALEEARSFEDILKLVCLAFPDQSEQTVKNDLKVLFNQLQKKNLIMYIDS